MKKKSPSTPSAKNSASNNIEIVFTRQAVEDLEEWDEKDKAKVKRISRLIEAIKANPRKGIGKPEQLQHQFSGYWSRRIDKKHRLIYRIEGDKVTVISCRGHYD